MRARFPKRCEGRKSGLRPLGAALLLAAIATLPAAPAAARMSAACNWVGLTIGHQADAWEAIVANGATEQAIRAHCNTIYCGRRTRGHYSMVYETMPCDDACAIQLRRRVADSCAY